MRYAFLFLSAVAAGFAYAAQSAESSSHTDGFRQQEAHAHGEAGLNLALDGEQLFIEFESPAINIIGFEHPPNSPEQHDLIAKAKAILNDGASLFALSESTECELSASKVVWSLDNDNAEHEGEHKADTDHAAESETHSEFHASYVFTCQTPQALSFIDLRLFEYFPATEKITAQIIGPRGQRAQTLSANASRIDF